MPSDRIFAVRKYVAQGAPRGGESDANTHCMTSNRIEDGNLLPLLLLEFKPVKVGYEICDREITGELESPLMDISSPVISSP
ncbi:unnamed protein product [Rodentolepis nana]|uniref:Uncharacterized protein n=1 Tax=Rodentolepis nana TaxID=102285 RepID=A0A0R3TVH9_RODNA|nr:unnamed protein product [Rodentolepis nana]